MSRDQTVIKSKLLDAMIPDISFKDQALPLQPRPNSKILQRPRSSMLTRQSYINLQEKLQETPFVSTNNGDNFISTVGSIITSSNVKICESQNAETQRRSNRKYIRVVSNPHELLFPNSPRQSTTNNRSMRKSAIFQGRKSTNAELSFKPASSQLRKGQLHHQSHALMHQPSSSTHFPINFSQTCSRNPSIKLDGSRINSLEKLIANDDIPKPRQPLSKATYLQLNDASNTLNIRENKPQPQIIYPTADFQSNILRVAIGKVQPVFRTIVRKDIDKSGVVQRAQSQSELKNGPQRPTPPHGIVIQKGLIHHSNPYSNSLRVNHMMGRENQMLKLDTNSLRTQIVRQVLR